MEVTVKRTFGQDLTVFQSSAMRARSRGSVAEGEVAQDESETQHQSLTSQSSKGSGSSGNQTVSRPTRQRRTAAEQVDQLARDFQSILELPDSALAEPDDKGLSRMHRAAERGFMPIFEKIAVTNKQLLEVKTSDGAGMTPLLVAVQANNLESVKSLTELGAKLEALDSKGHGIVDLCTMSRNCRILYHYAQLRNERMHVWKKLIKLVRSDFSEEAEAATWCLCQLTNEFNGRGDESVTEERTNTDDKLETSSNRNLTWPPLLEAGLVQGLTHVLKVSNNENVKPLLFAILSNLIGHYEIRDQAVYFGIVPVLCRILADNSSSIDRIHNSASIMAKLADVRQFPEDAQKHGVYSSLLSATNKVLAIRKDVSNVETFEPSLGALTQLVETMGSLVRGQAILQIAFGANPSAFTTFVNLYELGDVNQLFMTSLSESVSRLANGNYSNQKRFVDAGILERLVSLASHRSAQQSVQLAAVNAFRFLIDGNKQTQQVVLDTGLITLLWKVVKRCAEPAMKRSAAGCLWAVAEADIEERRRLAELMTSSTFVDFITSVCGPLGGVSRDEESNELLVIGAEGIEVLWSGVWQPTADPSAEILALSQLLNAGHATCVIKASLRALRTMCLSSAYVPRLANQQAVCRTLALRSVVALAYPQSPPAGGSDDNIVRMEAMLTLAVFQLGNRNIRDEITQLVRGGNSFNVDLVIHTINSSSDSQVKLLAGEALAAFSYNNTANQALIREALAKARSSASGHKLPFSIYRQHLLNSENEIFSCNAAFQAVLLSPFFDAESAAVCAAAGIKLLIDCLQSTNNDATRFYIADCIGRLAHTRPGIPEAMVAVSAVELLCDLMTSRVQFVSLTAAIAIGFLSFNCIARRRLLNRCRVFPTLMDIIVQYNPYGGKLPPELMEEWKHIDKLGLIAARSK